ncbi:MAG: hypothetical protein WD229_06195, partial [Pirellulales bacterium]
DEDYCDHCMGWIGPALHQLGAEVAAHEHNHCGQCWWEIRAIEESQPPVEVSADIRKDPRWGQGYLHRYAHHDKLPLLSEGEDADSCDVLVNWFRSADSLVVLGPGSSSVGEAWPTNDAHPAEIVSGRRYAAGDCPLDHVRGVLLEHDPGLLPAVAERFHSTERRPLLMHCYLPGEPMLNFAQHRLPRAVPILPLLIRSGVYTHQSQRRHPSTCLFAVLLAAALQKRIVVRDLERPSSQLEADDLEYLRQAWQHVEGRMDLPTNLRGVFPQHSPLVHNPSG